MDTQNPVAKRLVDQYGGRQETADALGVTRETIRLWLIRGIPLEKALDVENRTGGVITGEEILTDARQAA